MTGPSYFLIYNQSSFGPFNQLKCFKLQESIRRGHDDLGDHFLDCGDLANALKCYSRARDYCTSGRHVVNMCVNVIKVSVYLQVG
jgi:COP9 signalosome complex subunit 1